MTRHLLGAACGVISFFVGIGSSMLLRGESPYVENAPCDGCAAKLGVAYSDVPTIDLHDLAQSRGQHDGQLVRIRALFHHDSGYFVLYDSEHDHPCAVRTIFEPAYESCAGTRPSLDSLAGIGSWYDGAAEVTVIGRFTTLAASDAAAVGDFEIVCLEAVEPLPDDFYGPWLLRRGW